MRLKTFSVEGLFGLFDHEIPLRHEDRITIIHAPNGYGKTVILKLISSFFGGSLQIFREVEFKKLQFEFEDNSTVTITQRPADKEKEPSDNPQRLYTVSYKDKSGKLVKYDPWAEQPSDRKLESCSAIERSRIAIQNLSLNECLVPDLFRDSRSDEAIVTREIAERYLHLLSDKIPRQPPPVWFDGLRQSVHCRLIETQRLMVNAKEKTRSAREGTSLIPTVKTNSDDLVARIERCLAESATLSQTLDRTFPNRLLSESAFALTENELRERLTALEQLRARLTQAGLLDKSDDSSLIPETNFSESTRRILTEYVNDAEKKLQVFNELLARIELLTELINKRFKFKTVSVSRTHGLVFSDIRNRRVNLENLSSGEQHELVLAYDLLFKTKENTLLLIDEPEISLHIVWQKKFLLDLRRIIELSPMDIILSTHSPQLIGSHIDLAIQLQGPKK